MAIGKFMRTMVGALSLVGLLVGISTFTAHAASKEKIDRRVTEVMSKFREDVNGADSLLAKASAVLVFPSIKKAGIGIGAEYGEGALLIDGKTVDYYSTAAGSIGLQLGGQVRSQILLFMAPEKLDAFRKSDKWEVGVDGSVAVATVGAGGSIDSTNIDAPILAFIFNNKGLMYNLSLEGSKMSRIERN
ncbi:twin-arginine translocation pathway signal sequence domain-containing protein [Iodidimonas gelatinilytica]|uniref:Twin-arginine translocation pathway signal sequence domain-containing protein n=1 Tax=Iodidimonas gelatinilytica TaxID=1236966 RepID=A0A5A7MW53_9PROT|nr:lipid-binding SYLF domain-containing protein [Iodidimonas gelatinilytica]GER00152.1 twin-arginine translocation pathway signal sequence domain-containing protein [Iodidimonas gelatinilytica]